VEIPDENRGFVWGCFGSLVVKQEDSPSSMLPQMGGINHQIMGGLLVYHCFTIV
jgi:hypothetical protein